MILAIADRASAQLITDNQSRLNTIKVERKGLIWQSGPPSASANAHARGKRVTPRSAPRPGVYSLSGSPRYSQGNPYGGVLSLSSAPRYSRLPSHDYYRTNVRYSEDRSKNFQYEPLWARSNDPYNAQLAAWNGPYLAKFKPTKNSSPNARLMYSQNRNFNLMLVKVGGNNKTPDGVKQGVSKPKFDKKEREIWNN